MHSAVVPYLVNGARGMGSLASRLRGRCPPMSPELPPGPPGESGQSCGRSELELADLLYRSREPFSELIVAWIFINCRKRHTSCFCISIYKVYKSTWVDLRGASICKDLHANHTVHWLDLRTHSHCVFFFLLRLRFLLLQEMGCTGLNGSIHTMRL